MLTPYPKRMAAMTVTALAVAYAKTGKQELAASTLASVRAKIGQNATELNKLCWAMATHDALLETALRDCDAALRLNKTATILDSRGFVLFRLGRYAEAIQSYDAALRITPKQAASLYGRGMAKLKLGRTADGTSDVAAAKAVSGDIAKQFANYGVTA